MVEYDTQHTLTHQEEILRTPEEVDTWMTALTAEALKLQRSLPDGMLRIVAHGTKEDGLASAAAPAGRCSKSYRAARVPPPSRSV
jgi:hypothetical protein